MNRITLLFTLLAVSIAMVGCGSAETPPTDNPISKKLPDNPGTTTTDTTANVEMAKCGACGNMVAMASLKEHDGQKMCEECMKAHNH